MESFVSEILPKLKLVLSPLPIGIMDSEIDTCQKHLKDLTQFIKDHKEKLTDAPVQTGDDLTRFFYSVFEITDYFGFKKPVVKLQAETYLFAMEFISVFGILGKYCLHNLSGTSIFYRHINILDDQYFLYEDLFPNLFTVTKEVGNILTTQHDPMTVNMGICKYISAVARINIDNEIRLINEKHVENLSKSMEHVLKSIGEYLRKIDEKQISDNLRFIIFELIYQVELSANLFWECKGLLEPLIPLILPMDRAIQIGRTLLRTAVLVAELGFRKVLIALRCFQFRKVVKLCEMVLIKLEVNSFYNSDHEGVGEMCFNGFSQNFNEIADKILGILENLCIWSFIGSVEAVEMIVQVLINFYNLPAKKGWGGPWVELNERTINIINTLGALNKSNSVSTLFHK